VVPWLGLDAATAGGAISDASRWADRIMEEIDRRHPAKSSQQGNDHIEFLLSSSEIDRAIESLCEKISLAFSRASALKTYFSMLAVIFSSSTR
jgi:hypothetical protein